MVTLTADSVIETGAVIAHLGLSEIVLGSFSKLSRSRSTVAIVVYRELQHRINLVVTILSQPIHTI